MRNLNQLNQYRLTGPSVNSLYGWEGDETCGAFLVPSVIDRQSMTVIASTGQGWDHVSVSRKNRVPNYLEMDQVKRLFFADDETAMQLHVPVKDHINTHPNCLHLWRPTETSIPLPPQIFV